MRHEVKQALWGGAIWIPAALIIGIVVGGQGPKRDLERARAELEWLRAEARPRQVRMDPVMQMVSFPAPEPTRIETPPRASAPLLAENGDSEDEPLAATEITEPVASSAPSLEERLETARDLWQLRVDIARNTFVSRAALDRDAAARFDVLMAAMNLRIRGEFEAIAERIAEEEAFTPEDVTRMIHQITGALTLTYDELDRAMPLGWRSAAGTELDLFDFIDPSVAEPLLDVESLLDTLPERGPGARRRW